jgi:ribosomal protein S8
MNFKKKISQLISKINTGFINQVIEITHNYNKSLEKVLNLLIKERIIHGYKISNDKKKFQIQLNLFKNKIQKKPLLLKSKKSFTKIISEYDLKSAAYKNIQVVKITSTNEGLISNTFGKIKGGEFLFEISY